MSSRGVYCGKLYMIYRGWRGLIMEKDQSNYTQCCPILVQSCTMLQMLHERPGTICRFTLQMFHGRPGTICR
eukprot:g66061.t1